MSDPQQYPVNLYLSNHERKYPRYSMLNSVTFEKVPALSLNQKSASHFYGNICIPISEEKTRIIFLIFSKKDGRKLNNFQPAPKARTNQRLENLTCFLSTNEIAKLLFRRRS